MITCADLEEAVADYLDRSLPAGRRRALDQHLDTCGHCREFLAAYERTAWVARKVLKGAGAMPQAPEELVQAILGSRRR